MHIVNQHVLYKTYVQHFIIQSLYWQRNSIVTWKHLFYCCLFFFSIFTNVHIILNTLIMQCRIFQHNVNVNRAFKTCSHDKQQPIEFYWTSINWSFVKAAIASILSDRMKSAKICSKLKSKHHSAFRIAFDRNEIKKEWWNILSLKMVFKWK